MHSDISQSFHSFIDQSFILKNQGLKEEKVSIKGIHSSPIKVFERCMNEFMKEYFQPDQFTRDFSKKISALSEKEIDLTSKLVLDLFKEVISRGTYREDKNLLNDEIKSDHTSFAKMLIEEGINLEKKDSRFIQDSLNLAIEQGNLDLVKTLIETYHSRPNLSIIDLIWDAYDKAEYVEQYEIADMFLDKYPFVKAPSLMQKKMGMTRLIQGSKRGDSKYVRLLLNAGAKIEKTCEGLAAIHHAVMQGHQEVVKILVSHDHSTINSETDEKETPLIIAARKGDDDLVAFLLNQGADHKKRNIYGWSAYDYATHDFLKERPFHSMPEDLVNRLKNDGIDEESVDLFNQKLLAHRFSVNTYSTQNMDGNRIGLNGLHFGITLNKLNDSVKNFFDKMKPGQLPKEFTDEMSEEIIQVLSKAPENLLKPAEDLYHQYQNGNTILLGAQAEHHAIVWLIANDEVYRANRGRREEGMPSGIMGFRKNDQKPLTLEDFNRFKKQDRAFHEGGSITKVGFKNFQEMPMEDQKIGSCTWANAKGAFRALLYATMVKKGIKPAVAKALSYKIYKMWSMGKEVGDRESAVNKVLDQYEEAFEKGDIAITSLVNWGLLLFVFAKFKGSEQTRHRLQKFLIDHSDKVNWAAQDENGNNVLALAIKARTLNPQLISLFKSKGIK